MNYGANSLVTNTLVTQAIEGDISSLEKLLKETEKISCAVLYYLIKDEFELSDTVQDILLKVVKNLKNLKKPSSYRAWLNKIILSRYYDYLRKQKSKNSKIISNDILENECNLPDVRRTPAEELAGRELEDVIKKSLCSLSEPYRAALVMREFEGLSYEDIADATKTNIGTVKSRIARARSRLRDAISPYIK